MNPRSMLTPESRTRRRSPTSSAGMRADQLAFDRRARHAHEGALVRRAGDDRVERLADARLHHHRRGRLAHLPLDLVGRVLLLRALRRDRPRARRGCTATDDRRAPPSPAAASPDPGSGGSAPSSASSRAPRARSARAARRPADRRRIRRGRAGGSRWSRDRETCPDPPSCGDRERPASATESAAAGSVSPSCSASARMRSQRSGDFTTRRSDGKPRLSRNRAVTPLAAIIRLAISDFARFVLLRPHVVQRVAVEHRARPRSSRSRARRARRAARRAPARRDPACAAAASMPGTAAAAGGSGPSPSSHAPTRVVGELGLVVHRPRRRCPTPSPAPSVETTNSITTARRSC